jgi:hypothetical protein
MCGSGGIVPAILTLSLDCGEWSASRIYGFISREIAPGTLWMGGWLNPEAGPDFVRKRNSYEDNRTQGVETAALCYKD